MAATKRTLAEDDTTNGVPDLVKPSKKQKVKDVAATEDGDEAALKKQKKKEKKEKKRKQEAEEEGGEEKSKDEKKKEKEEKKKRKEEKREKKRQQEEAAQTTSEDVSMKDAEEEAPKKKDKKDKKDKKKKDAEANGESAPAATNGAVSAGFYHQTSSLSALPQSEIDAFLADNAIVIEDTKSQKDAVLRPIISFDQLPSSDLLSKSPFAAYKNPTPIQSASWPWTLAGRDAIGVAETGSGKTMAFALPLVESLYRASKAGKKQRGIKAVVVSPTRELAMQTHEQTSQLASLVGLKCLCVYGGSPKEEQRALIQRGVDIIVATPGRLKDFMSDGTIDLSGCRFAVLDEADRMLDKGFEDDIKAILGAMPERQHRQTLMFTATWPISVRVLANTFMVDPVKITIARPNEDPSGAGGEQLQANIRISQSVEVMDGREKERRLLQILKQYHAKGANDRILVFCLYKKEATRVETFLQQRGISVCGIHGDLRQEQRTRSLEAFKTGQTPVLVATDVAARGLDIPEVKLVINVTFPLTIEDYVHRIGRTGRAGKTGEAITFFTQQDKTHSGALINILKGANQPVPDELFKFGTTVKKKAHDTYGAFFKDVDMTKKATKIVFD